MKAEIGSEFWSGCTPLNGTGVSQLLPAGMDTRYTLCGRTALELVLRDAMAQRQLRKAYLPSYCCHTMIEPFVSKGITVEFYDVFFTDTGIGCNFKEENDCDLVFLMDYFGFRSKNTHRLAKQQRTLDKCVVYDATHALFCENMDYSNCDYVFGSFRKWFNVNAGFCAKAGTWIGFPSLRQNHKYSQQRNTAFDQKQAYMAGKPLEKDIFLHAFSHAEDSLETDYIEYAPDNVSLQVLKSVNVEYIRNKRRENASFIIDAINTFKLHHIVSPHQVVREGDCPLFVPLRVNPSVRATLRRQLIENRVYLPIHWPLSSLHNVNRTSQIIYDVELSFVCDQRYEAADMRRAVQIIRSFNNA